MDGVIAAPACIRGGGDNATVEVVVWDSPEQALVALAGLFSVPCSRRCRMNHFVMTYQPGGDEQTAEHWHAMGLPPSPPPPLAQELDALYQRHTLAGEAEAWPTPPALNESLSNPLRPNATRPRIRNGQRLALAQALAHVAP